MGVFAASDIVEVAIRIEENGVNFYKFAEQITKQQEAKELFAHLAQEEIKHKKIFENMFAKMEKANTPESYEGEYSAYLRSYVDNNIIFTKEAMDKELTKVTDTIAASILPSDASWIQSFITMKLNNCCLLRNITP